jgi:hypothetical protein
VVVVVEAGTVVVEIVVVVAAGAIVVATVLVVGGALVDAGSSLSVQAANATMITTAPIVPFATICTLLADHLTNDTD